jgi:uncharacterized membrane protein
MAIDPTQTESVGSAGTPNLALIGLVLSLFGLVIAVTLLVGERLPGGSPINAWIGIARIFFFVFSVLVACAMSLAGITVGVVALATSTRRRMAVAAIIVGALPILIVMGYLLFRAISRGSGTI